MDPYSETTVVDDPNAEARRLAMLEHCGLLGPTAEQDLDRWIGDLRRETGSRVAAISLLGVDRTLVKTRSTADGQALTAYLEAPIVVEATRSP